jgi:hypothetical protein
MAKLEKFDGVYLPYTCINFAEYSYMYDRTIVNITIFIYFYRIIKKKEM